MFQISELIVNNGRVMRLWQVRHDLCRCVTAPLRGENGTLLQGLVLHLAELVADFQIGTAWLAHEVAILAKAKVGAFGVILIQQVGQAQAT